MKELKQEMEVLLNLDDYGYESSTAGEFKTTKKTEKLWYHLSLRIWCDVQLKRLLEKNKSVLKTGLDKQYLEKKRFDEKRDKREDRWIGYSKDR